MNATTCILTASWFVRLQQGDETYTSDTDAFWQRVNELIQPVIPRYQTFSWLDSEIYQDGCPYGGGGKAEIAVAMAAFNSMYDAEELIGALKAIPWIIDMAEDKVQLMWSTPNDESFRMITIAEGTR